MKLKNKYYILRHGEAISNVKNIVSSWPEKFNNPLTDFGREIIKKVAEELKNKNIDLIFSSDLLRTKETAEIIEKELGVKIGFDERLREINFGVLNSESIEKFYEYFKSENERIKNKVPGGESHEDVLKRVLDFLEETDRKYENKNILIVSHQLPLLLLEGAVKGFSILETIENFPEEKMLQKGELRKLN